MKVFKTVLVMLFLLSSSLSKAAAGDAAWIKLGRGAVNVISSPVEILRQPLRLSATGRYEPLTALTGGVFKGIGCMVVRALGGVYEMLTFPIPLPRNYAPLMNPPTLFEEMRYTSKNRLEPLTPSASLPRS